MIDTKTSRENLYQWLMERDVIGKLKPILEKYGYVIRIDGKWTKGHVIGWNTPWIHQHQDHASECELWHKLFFNVFNKVPTYCQNCWKVVVFIPTLKNLFDLYELQKELEHPCKCGVEYRFTDERRYGGYFYNWGQEEGQKCYQKIRKAVDKKISPDIKVILKCACSEFEIACGPPDEWKADEEQLRIEKMLKEWVVLPNERFHQFSYIKIYTMLRWIHHAVHIGDLTYKEFTDGNPLVKQMKTYHEEVIDDNLMEEVSNVVNKEP